MTDTSLSDPAAAHRHFSVACFNAAWQLIDRPARTPAEDEIMLLLAQASLWHWSQRDDCTATNLSISYWQVSRVYSLIGNAGEAKDYALLSLEAGRDSGPFYLGYAYEALARAESVAGNAVTKAEYLSEAARYAAEVADADEKALLLDDLARIG